ncbi:MAG TPA: ribosome small subunit-dependent GTPase A [Verrucomicrobiae bacterium]|nr:ribosome small subunit-dependent GTPase A [Verrucomicrobiae bacterium]
MNLTELGWKDCFTASFRPFAEQGYSVGRVCAELKHVYRIYSEAGEHLAQISGRLRYDASGRGNYPAVGDWVAVSLPEEQGSRAVIHGILPRFSKFSRKAAGEVNSEQIVATNIDTVFLVTALNHDYNLRRLERYLTLAWESGASPVIILSKADLCKDAPERMAEVSSSAPGVPVHLMSSVSGQGIDQVIPYLREGSTVALLGSSGAGKSTLINRIAGKDIQRVSEVRHGDDRGRHTTTHRELIMLPQGGLIIDTPGMREVQLWGSGEGFDDTFEDITEFAVNCRFTDCRHGSEPGCAVQNALDSGVLDEARFQNYLKLKKELAYLARKENRLEQLAEKEKWKKINKQLKEIKPR